MARPKKKKHDSGLYRKSLVVGRDELGDPIRQYVYGHTVGECDDKLAQLRIDHKMGVVVTDKRSTWGYWAQAWKSIKDREVGKSTRYMYAAALKHLAVLDNIPASEITVMDMSTVVADMMDAGFSRKTIKTTISTASQVCALARKNRAMLIDITDDIVAPKDAPVSVRRALPADEQAAIWGAAPLAGETSFDRLRAQRLPMARMFALTALCCGLRRGEIAGLMWSDVDFDDWSISVERSVDFYSKNKTKVPKTASGVRKVPMSQDYRAELLSWREAAPLSVYVFPGAKGRALTEGQFTSYWHALIDTINGITVSARASAARTKKAPVVLPVRKIDFGCHDLRHTFATNAIAKGVDIKTLQYLMGHADAGTLLNIYSHFSPAAWQAAAEILGGKTTKKQDEENNMGQA